MSETAGPELGPSPGLAAEVAEPTPPLNLEFAQKRARALLNAYRAGDPAALVRVQEHGSRAQAADSDPPEPITLAAAQLVIAREHGLASWARLKEEIRWPDFRDAIHLMDRGDLPGFTGHLEARPYLVRMRTPHPAGKPVDYFSGAFLLHYVAGNPSRESELPANMPEIAAAILRRSGDPNARTLAGSTTAGLILSSAAAARAGVAASLLDVLKAAGARDNLETEEALLFPLRNCAYTTALALRQRGHRVGLRSAAGLGELETVRRLLAEDGSNVPGLSRQHELNQALTYATIPSHLEVMDLLLSHGAEINSIPPVFGNPGTALHIASTLEAAQLLVEHGADLYVRDPNYGVTPADWAEHENHTEIAAFLRTQMNLTPKSPSPVNIASTPTTAVPARNIFDAVTAGDLQSVRSVLQQDPSLVHARESETERTPLHLAAAGGHLEIARLLLESGADYYARDVLEQLPLDLPPGQNRTAVHDYLGAINRERNHFLGVCVHGELEEVRALLAKDPSLVHTKDILEGTPPLIFAACKPNPGLVSLLLESGADPNWREWSTGCGPLYFAAENGHVENVRLLLKAGADPNAVWPVNYGATKMQMNALHLAAWKGHPEVVRLLLEAGVAVDGRARSYAQFTPLHFAATEGHLEIVKMLVARGADPSLRDGRRGIDTYEMARNHEEVLSYLESVQA